MADKWTESKIAAVMNEAGMGMAARGAWEACEMVLDARAERDKYKAEVEMLRGVGCLEDGDGPCGVCIKCTRAEVAELRAEITVLRRGSWVDEYDTACAERDELRIENAELRAELNKTKENVRKMHSCQGLVREHNTVDAFTTARLDAAIEALEWVNETLDMYGSKHEALRHRIAELRKQRKGLADG